MLLPDLTDYFQGEKSLFHRFQVLLWFCFQQGQDLAVALCLSRKSCWCCWKLQMIQSWSNVSAWHEETPYCKCCHLSSEAQIQCPYYLWLLKVSAHLLKCKALNPCVLAKIYFQGRHSGYQHFLYCSRWRQCWSLHPVPNYVLGSSLFWNSWYFPETTVLQWCVKWSLYIPHLSHRNGMRINKLWPNCDPSEAKRRFFPLASWGPGLASVWISLFWDTSS